jgi:hypothetical protein
VEAEACRACPFGGAAGRKLENLRWLEYRIPRASEILREVAASNGQNLCASSIGRRLGLSRHAVKHRIRSLESAGLVRILPALVRGHAHVLLRDCRLLRGLGGDRRALVQTCLVERVLSVYASRTLSARYFQWKASRTKRIELILRADHETVGFCFKDLQIPRNKDFAALRLGIKNKVVDRGFFVCFYPHSHVTAGAAIGLPVSEFLGQLDRWLACRSFGEARQVLRDLLATRRRA